MGLWDYLNRSKSKTLHSSDYRNNVYTFNQKLLGCLAAVYVNDHARECIGIINEELPKVKEDLHRYRKLRRYWEITPPTRHKETIDENIKRYSQIERQISEVIHNAGIALKEKYICLEHYNIKGQTIISNGKEKEGY